MGKTKQKYKSKWEEDLDATVNQKLGNWCTASCKNDVYFAYCKLCNAEISVANMGKQSLLQHAKKEKHIRALKESKKFKQPSLQQFVKPSISSHSLQDATQAAEMKWVSFIAENNLPMNISENIGKFFKSMFPDSKIAENFSCGRTKATYLIADGLGHAYHINLCEQMKTKKFSLMIDESNKVQGQKYLHMLVKFYDEDQQSEVTHFYKATVVNKASSDNIVAAINSSFVEDEIPWNNVLQVMSDSPNVMRGCNKGVIAQIKKKYVPHLLDIGGCSLHHIHNVISYATSALGKEIEELAVDIFAFFKHRTGLCEEYKHLQVLHDVEEHNLLRFVSSRWLIMLPVVNRLLEQWVPLQEFFRGLHKHHADVANQDRTKRILQGLNELTRIKMLFLQAVLPEFDAFEKLFQSTGTKVHILHDEIVHLLKNVMVQFLLPSTVEEAFTRKEIHKCEYEKIDNQLPDHKLAIGRATAETIRNGSLTTLDKKLFYTSVRSFFKVATQKLIHYLPLGHKFLSDLRFLQPQLQREPTCLSSVTRVAAALASVCEEIDVDRCTSEWRNYALENTEVCKTVATLEGKINVTKYWSAVSTMLVHPGGEPQFPNLFKVVKCVLSLAHGNADTERSFSQTSQILTKHRNSMNPILLNGLMSMKSHFHAKGINSQNLIISPMLQISGRESYARHKERCAQAQREAKESEKKKKLAAAEKELMAAMQKQVAEEKNRKCVEAQEESASKKKKEAEKLFAEAKTFMKKAEKAMVEGQKKNLQSNTEERNAVKEKEKIVKKQLKRVAADILHVQLSNKKAK